MLLHINKDRKIEFYDIVDDDSKIAEGVVEHYDGVFTFFDGDYIQGKEKEFFLNEDGTIRIEYVDSSLETITQLDRIEETVNALAADSVTVEKLNAAITEGVNEV